MPPSIADIAQRSVALTSVALCVLGVGLTAHGIGYRALRARGYVGGPDEPKAIDPPSGSPSAPPS
ncbi:hypothetical protein L202_06085 [Cryptococcus amylolentus CBS 6039]|uniref:Uncharacterized protein n=2 Tax=Cryptococcus amylolentus TaxID=104669 RepID=A0A1E3HJ51_9TREE|nr:hypothetical protein L202_06085 [Cryptococcus amylolentus CBS 6039]ODN76165.1 hypothetical protein L202_06085 [Cryptococcus amylolentus CBS 6039]ODN96347.1 hypothetical protein I350_08374 [Cryptococcus amylolentus CBS 6273]